MILNSEEDPLPGSLAFWLYEVCVNDFHTRPEHFEEHIV
jgi:hypothetical protein